MDSEEDAQNKPDRPLPAKRITLRTVLILRWALVPSCFGLSILLSAQVLYASVALVAFTIIYNELGAHAKHWAIRNVVNAAGFGAFEWGSTLIAGKDPSILSNTGVLAVCISVGIFATTIQAQDFKDVEGDRQIHRQTLPILFPATARYTIITTLLLWSFLLVVVWELPAMTAFMFISLAAWVGARYIMFTSCRDDQVSFYWYNVWLSAARFKPAIWRYSTPGPAPQLTYPYNLKSIT